MALGLSWLRSTAPRRNRPVVETLEPRILFSADALAGLFDPLQTDPYAVEAPPLLLPAEFLSEHALAEASPAAPEATAASIELVVVDARVADYQSLISDIQARADTAHQFEIIVLNQIDSGIQQITDLLAARRDVSAVHIISHGQDGGVQLGAGWVDAQALQQQAEALAQWRAALTSNADILLYGCDVAAGTAEIGRASCRERV